MRWSKSPGIFHGRSSAPKRSLEPRHSDAVIQGHEQQHRPCCDDCLREIEYRGIQNIIKFHEVRSALNSESTACFTDGHKGSDAALPAVYLISHMRVLS